MSKFPGPQLPSIGWREWVSLPTLGVDAIKAKVDTGARSSSLHAYDLKTFDRDGRAYVRFKVHPKQRDTKTIIVTEAVILEYRVVTSSGGHRTRRPVIVTPVELLGHQWDIELTLAARDTMGFRMLLGRQAIRHRFVVDPGHSYLGGRTSGRKTKPRKNHSDRKRRSL